jgi:hypothetical protein
MNGGYNNSSFRKPQYGEIDSIIDTEQLKWDKFKKLKQESSSHKLVRPSMKNMLF